MKLHLDTISKLNSAAKMCLRNKTAASEHPESELIQS